ncbi:hypothetical protein VJ923_02855 [Adlercreutzia sp. R25]|uniref:Uncharacterized protein n=1 Tax=Adlercreutzia shanghongiae TaxID=3111773 RepID=A0ABU6IVK8_9ACTN|nr:MULTISPECIES: hypothetical protein [unclassified Adlercreutzia]MEC4272097.1 hypothetical protein [Adlercreutzia sp. R25]MEC4293828.1 hypothetical protein [Adlercreutzia sp. R22]
MNEEELAATAKPQICEKLGKKRCFGLFSLLNQVVIFSKQSFNISYIIFYLNCRARSRITKVQNAVFWPVFDSLCPKVRKAPHGAFPQACLAGKLPL